MLNFIYSVMAAFVGSDLFQWFFPFLFALVLINVLVEVIKSICMP